LRDKTNASEIRQWYQNERNSYSGISLNKESVAIHQESDNELVQMQGEIKYERGYVKKLDPNVTPESGFKIQSRFWGYQWPAVKQGIYEVFAFPSFRRGCRCKG